jgi:glutamate dehydrogenase/leucine dehydrogenase
MATLAYEVSAETEVLQSLDRFYEAINSMFTGNLKPMEQICSRSPELTMLTPFGGRQVGWSNVREQLLKESQLKFQGRVEPRDVLVRVFGNVGYTVSRITSENLTIGGKPFACDMRSTCIFRREGSAWKLVHHHVDLKPEAQGLKP